MILTCVWPHHHVHISNTTSSAGQKNRCLTLKHCPPSMTINICDNTILDDITKWSAGCAAKSKAVIWRVWEGYRLDHVFISIQQHNCGESKELINKHLKSCQWSCCLQHVMSEVHRLPHSGTQFVSLLAVIVQPYSNQCWPVFIILQVSLQDLEKSHHMWTRCALHPDPITMDCSPSVVSITSHETKGKNISIHGQVQITEWWLLISYSISY